MIKKRLYLDKSTPDDFINADLMDWVYLIGDISTPYELDFVRQFGHAMKQHDNQIRNATLDVLDLECQEIKSRIESSAMGKPLSERERGRIIEILDVRIKIKSLRKGDHP